MENRIGTIIYTRLSSKRLPKKALIEINEISLIERVIIGAKKINSHYHIIATSAENEDNVFEDIAKKHDLEIIRGDLENVAKRTIDCINKYKLDYFIRINGDSPIIPIDLINMAIESLRFGNITDLITNIYPRTFPYGYSVEIINSFTFKNNFVYLTKEQCEHITQIFYENHLKFKIENIINTIPITSQIKLTVDDEETLLKIQKIFNKYPDIQIFTLKEILMAYKNTIN
jgi:spore coat polysaccharide biosynthesis protein SpsF